MISGFGNYVTSYDNYDNNSNNNDDNGRKLGRIRRRYTIMKQYKSVRHILNGPSTKATRVDFYESGNLLLT
jgi:hypothetical protein